jgi:hypothetical protein
VARQALRSKIASFPIAILQINKEVSMIPCVNGSVLKEYDESPPNAEKKGAAASRPERPRAKANSLLTVCRLSSRQQTRSSDGGAGANGFEPPKGRGRPSTDSGNGGRLYSLGDVNSIEQPKATVKQLEEVRLFILRLACSDAERCAALIRPASQIGKADRLIKGFLQPRSHLERWWDGD